MTGLGSQECRAIMLPDQRRSYGSSEVAREVGISLAQLYHWVGTGIVQPRLEQFGIRKFRRFTDQDIEVLRMVKELTDDGYPVSRAAEKVREALCVKRES